MSQPTTSKFPFGLRLTVYVIVIGLMVSITIPVMLPARTVRAMNACEANLKQIDGATRSWALENKKGSDDTVNFQEVVVYLRGGVPPVCPAGGSYQVNRVKDKPTCTLGPTLGHSLW